MSNDRLPIGTIPLFASSSPDYVNSLNTVVQSANKVYCDFLQSEDGIGFCGQVSVVGDSVGSVLAYDALCRPYASKRSLSESSVAPGDEEGIQFTCTYIVYRAFSLLNGICNILDGNS